MGKSIKLGFRSQDQRLKGYKLYAWLEGADKVVHINNISYSSNPTEARGKKLPLGDSTDNTDELDNSFIVLFWIKSNDGKVRSNVKSLPITYSDYENQDNPYDVINVYIQSIEQVETVVGNKPTTTTKIIINGDSPE